jgi:hypothetical protein
MSSSSNRQKFVFFWTDWNKPTIPAHLIYILDFYFYLNLFSIYVYLIPISSLFSSIYIHTHTNRGLLLFSLIVTGHHGFSQRFHQGHKACDCEGNCFPPFCVLDLPFCSPLIMLWQCMLPVSIFFLSKIFCDVFLLSFPLPAWFSI